MRVAIIFDNTARPETTGLYCRRALEKLAETTHFLPNQLDEIEASAFDLFVFIDDGLEYSIPKHLVPAVWWAIDTHLNFGRCMNKAIDAQFVFAAQKDGAEAFHDAGIRSAKWLPLACDPEIHCQRAIARDFDFSFVGHLVTSERKVLFEQLQSEFPNSFVGQAYFDEMSEKYSASKLIVNQSVRDDVNMRVFEAMACGGLLLTNALPHNGLSELFTEGQEYVAFQSPEEVREKLRYYLDHDDERRAIAEAGNARVLAEHTYHHRMEEVLRCVKAAPAAVTASVDLKDAMYFEHARPEVLALVPTEARQVLDIGCGAGRLGEQIQQRQDADVTGVERSISAAAVAETRLSKVIIADVEAKVPEFEVDQFDCVILADVLEHLRHPESALANVRNWLREDGTLVGSIPNLRHHSTLGALLHGHFTYEAAGLLDEDHVRFFTRREIEKLFFRAGFEIEQLSMVPGPGDRDWNERAKDGSVSLGAIELTGLPEAEAAEFFAYQYLVVARPRPKQDFDLTSIVIPTHNQLSCTKECLDSIRMRTDEPIEIIVVDNGSTDGSVEYLRNQSDVRLIENPSNEGFPVAVNQGIRASTGENILLLNNDTVVTTGWLNRMLSALHDRPGVGLVGPLSNNVSGEQQIPVHYRSLAEMDGFAWDLGQQADGQRIETDRLVGFCLLFSRKVVDSIGLLDEQFGIGCFEDDDYCRRALAAGFTAVIATDAFVHHYGSQTFAASGIDFGSLLEENQSRFNQKWGVEDQPTEAPNFKEAGDISPDFDVDTSANGKLLIPKRPKISLCMIVRDNETTIGPCLASIRPWVDEIIVVDTGSTDRTPDICREYGARMFEFPWCDDFSAARNESIRHATGEWIFWMDSDDTIPEEQGRKLRKLAYSKHETGVFGYTMQVHCPSVSDSGGATQWTVVDHVKLFRNLPELRFEHRIHEQIIPAIRRVGGKVQFTDLHVVHSGSDQSPATRARKLERDYRILKLDLADKADHPFVLFNLGMTFEDDGKYEQACEYLERCLAVSQTVESHVPKAHSLLVSSLIHMGKLRDAEDRCREALRLFPDDKELLFRRAMLLHELGDLDAAVLTYNKVLEARRQRKFESIDPGVYGYKARHNLALVYTALGQLREAELQWREILKVQPGHLQAWTQLAELLVNQNRIDDLQSLANQSAQNPQLASIATTLRSRVMELRGNLREARRILDDAAKQSDNEFLLNAHARFLFERVGPAEAISTLQKLLSKRSADAQLLHNMGLALVAAERPVEAIEFLQRSLDLREDWAPTRTQLARAYLDSGSLGEAEQLCKRIIEDNPEHMNAVALLDEIESLLLAL
jgi:GT2 family glycosyltransferase/tetratricopeptide (TPR) repeat protein/2-polyprenyl-3-methyl-5-hydroxy-6-metoxy-1,4-benzoquinol methylase